MTPLRVECIKFIEDWVYRLDRSRPLRVLDVGIAGDPKPGGNYYLFKDDQYETSDIDSRYEPTYVFDICTPPKELANTFDVVILSNTIEHLPEPAFAIRGCYELLKTGGTVIVDCPWVYPYHAEDAFLDYWRISQDGMRHLLSKSMLSNIQIHQGQWCTSAMGVKI